MRLHKNEVRIDFRKTSIPTNHRKTRLVQAGIPAYVADIDDLNAESIAALFPGKVFGGWGETFWIKDGRIVRSLEGYDLRQADLLEAYTREIVA